MSASKQTFILTNDHMHAEIRAWNLLLDLSAYVYAAQLRLRFTERTDLGARLLLNIRLTFLHRERLLIYQLLLEMNEVLH